MRVFDGDGCIAQRKGTDTYLVDFTGTEEVCNSIIDIIPDNIDYIYRYKRHPNRINNIVSFRIGAHHNVNEFLTYIYKDAKIYLDRKYNKYKKFLKTNKYEKYKEIIHMSESGLSCSEISKKLNMYYATVWRILARYRKSEIKCW